MKSFQAQTYYELLEISVGATSDEIRNAFERLNRLYSDDQVVLYGLIEPGQAAALRDRLQEALDVLADEPRRASYDASIGLPPRELSPLPPSRPSPLASAPRATSLPSASSPGWAGISWVTQNPAPLSPPHSFVIATSGSHSGTGAAVPATRAALAERPVVDVLPTQYDTRPPPGPMVVAELQPPPPPEPPPAVAPPAAEPLAAALPAAVLPASVPPAAVPAAAVSLSMQEVASAAGSPPAAGPSPVAAPPVAAPPVAAPPVAAPPVAAPLVAAPVAAPPAAAPPAAAPTVAAPPVAAPPVAAPPVAISPVAVSLAAAPPAVAAPAPEQAVAVREVVVAPGSSPLDAPSAIGLPAAVAPAAVVPAAVAPAAVVPAAVPLPAAAPSIAAPPPAPALAVSVHEVAAAPGSSPVDAPSPIAVPTAAPQVAAPAPPATPSGLPRSAVAAAPLSPPPAAAPPLAAAPPPPEPGKHEEYKRVTVVMTEARPPEVPERESQRPLEPVADTVVRAREVRPEPKAVKPFEVGPAVEFNGDLIRQVRMARGVSLVQLAEKTRISVRHLENLEADRYDSLPAVVYLRGILVSVARELGLDGVRVARSYLSFVEARRSKG